MSSVRDGAVVSIYATIDSILRGPCFAVRVSVDSVHVNLHRDANGEFAKINNRMQDEA